MDDYLIERICSFIRVGASPNDAIIAAGVESSKVDEVLSCADYEIKRATAQFVVLSCNRIMSEGGASGAKYLLSKASHAKKLLDELEEESGEDDGLTFDFSLDALGL